MTKVEIFKNNWRIVRYRATGHTEYAEHGQDIVCAALSVTLQFPLAGLQGILEIVPKFEINSDGFLEVNLSGMELKERSNEVETLLKTMVLMLEELAESYPKYIKLVEKEEL